MALSIPCQTAQVVSVDEYVEHVAGTVDLEDLESVISSAPMLQALANNRSLVVNSLNSALEKSYKGVYLASAQVLVLGRTDDFYVRAGIWPSARSVAGGRIYQEQFSYHLAHDHNFMFMTVNYLGPGYDTDIYEYDYDRLEGFVGEPVELTFLEKKRFGAGSVMLYRASKDVHVQHPPPELTITLNLLWAPPEMRLREQFIFDLEKKQVSGYSEDGDANKRISILSLAAVLGNGNTQDILLGLASSHPCRRTRLAAYEATARLAPNDAEATWTRAADDPAALVSRHARAQLERGGN